ncbi:MAG: hypothetical protein J7M26_00335, partial [Armatimonadetes bacterium]|nr:hypothetical protein [Armatimonadota bacterium]
MVLRSRNRMMGIRRPMLCLLSLPILLLLSLPCFAATGVVGRVMAPDGSPLPSTTVYLVRSSSQTSPTLVATAVSDNQGRFYFLQAIANSIGDYVTCVCLPKGYAWSSGQVIEGRAAITAHPAVTMAGTVLGSDGRPLAGARVRLSV